ncbi:MAG: lipocalin family protein [Leptospirales bacterium]|jgi:apolipoprotein D and lipocalin family protein
MFQPRPVRFSRLSRALAGLALLFYAGCADSGFFSNEDDGDTETLRTLYLATLPAPLPTVAFVDPARYAGVWYEVASLPQFFSVGCNCTTATYGIIDSSTISVFNDCRLNSPSGPANTITGRALVSPGTGNSKLEVEFVPLFRAPYWIIALADDYSHALVGDPFRGSLFVLSRGRTTLNASTYDSLIAYAATLGFNTAAVQQTPQAGCP